MQLPAHQQHTLCSLCRPRLLCLGHQAGRRRCGATGAVVGAPHIGLPHRLPKNRTAHAAAGSGHSGLRRQDTPYPGWDAAQQQQQQQSKGGVGRRRQGQPGGEAMPEQGAEQGSAACGSGGSPVPASVPAAAGAPPEHPHHAGKPPGLEHALLDAEHGGSAADDLVPPLEDLDRP